MWRSAFRSFARLPEDGTNLERLNSTERIFATPLPPKDGA
jgi:hypothetical protein